jgi:hypothetical protein
MQVQSCDSKLLHRLVAIINSFRAELPNWEGALVSLHVGWVPCGLTCGPAAIDTFLV